MLPHRELCREVDSSKLTSFFLGVFPSSFPVPIPQFFGHNCSFRAALKGCRRSFFSFTLIQVTLCRIRRFPGPRCTTLGTSIIAYEYNSLPTRTLPKRRLCGCLVPTPFAVPFCMGFYKLLTNHGIICPGAVQM